MIRNSVTILLLLPLFILGCTEEPVAKTGLSWEAPTVRADGTPLSLGDIGGYKLYYSEHKAGLYSLVADVQANNFDYSGLTRGTHYVYVTTYDTDGYESTASNIVAVKQERL